MNQERRAILGDPTIMWPGTKVEIIDGIHKGLVTTILRSYHYGKEYCVSFENNVTINLKRDQIKEVVD